MDRTDLNVRFAYHPAGDAATRHRHAAVRNACREAAGLVDEMAPDSREKSLAITNLEQAMMWANAAIARHQGAD